MEISTSTLPRFILRNIARVISFGAFAPGNSTAPISRSQSGINSIKFASLEYSVCKLSIARSRNRKRSTSISRIVTSARRPFAIRMAFTPEVPPPTTTTLPGKTPGTPPSSTPLPPLYFARKYAPITTDIRPAISLIGSSNGRRLFT